MTQVVLLVSADGSTSTQMNLDNQPMRISLPEGAVVETRNPMSGHWQAFAPKGSIRHRFTDFSILD